MYKNNQNRVSKVTRSILVPLFGALAIGLSSVALAQWKWVDETGAMHFSDSAPPASIPNENILSKPSAAKPALHRGETQALREPAPVEVSAADRKLEEERKRLEAQEAKDKAAQEAEIAAQKKEACANAKSRVELFSSGMRMRDIDAKGEFYYLEDADIAKRLAEAKEKVKQYCN